MAPGFFEKKAVEVVEELMEKKGIEPGELNKRVEATLTVIDELAPHIRKMEEVSSDLNGNVSDLEQEINEFNNNSDEMTEALDNLAESMDKVHDLIEDVAEEEE